MTNNEVALIFEKAEYYTLQEACDYLNLKNNTSNLTVKKLFNNILKYETNVYFYARGFNVTADFDIPSLKDLDDKEREVIIKSIDYACCLLDVIIYHGNGLLLLLEQKELEKFRFSSTIQFYGQSGVFCGALSFDSLQNNPISLEFLPNIDKSIINRVLAIYPRFFRYFDEAWECVFNKSTLKIHSYEIYTEDEVEEYAEAYCCIGIDELIVLHKDLIELESNIIKNTPIDKKTTKEIELKPRQGVSAKKIRAKERAKLIARVLWNNDKRREIRISEMASIVYAELYGCEFSTELPQNQDSLQDWIRDIAPSYAKVGGRPKKEN